MKENRKQTTQFLSERLVINYATVDDLDAIFSLIQTVGKEMDKKNDDIFAYSKSKDPYLKMLQIGICAVAVSNDQIVASLLTRPEDNREGLLELAGLPPETINETIEFVTCQVLEQYRGYRLEQKLINFVLKKLESTQYKYAICTVAPNNKPSLKSVQNLGFKICAEVNTHGNKLRYVLKKEL